MVNIFGFTLLKNGIKYDYSFRECLLSLKPVCKSVYLALGDSEDETEKAIDKLDFIKKIPTVWDPKLKAGAVILSQQTNVALDALREDHGEDENAWGIYLQCDEVFHEDDHEMIIEDIRKANEQGCDVIRFRYLHFWQDHHHIAINKKWYPHEIRAVRLKTNIESWGDAQSFRNFTKVYESEARIFHYGHVREDESYLEKKRDILKLYHEEEDLPKYRKKEIKHDNRTECLIYFGEHPKVMHERIKRLGDIVEFKKVDDVHIVGNKEEIDNNLIQKINADNVHFHSSLSDVPADRKDKAVLLEPSFFHKILKKTSVPNKMRSKLARPWSKDFILTLRLSEKGIGFKA